MTEYVNGHGYKYSNGSYGYYCPKCGPTEPLTLPANACPKCGVDWAAWAEAHPPVSLGDILHELTMMRELMEWEKTEYLKRQAEDKAQEENREAEAAADAERQRAEIIAVNEVILAKGAELAKKAQLEAARQAYEEHVALHHRDSARGIPS